MERTLENLTKAFVGESQARNRYTFYAKIAQKEGFEQIAGIFLETAEQEKTHAKRLFEHIQEVKELMNRDNSEIVVECSSPNSYGTTTENLRDAANGEKYEHSEMYPNFAVIAEEEGLDKIAKRFKSIAQAEKHHEERYLKLLKEVEAGSVHKKGTETVWICRECGYMHVGNEAPEVCPSCDHPRAYYQVQNENY